MGLVMACSQILVLIFSFPFSLQLLYQNKWPPLLPLLHWLHLCSLLWVRVTCLLLVFLQESGFPALPPFSVVCCFPQNSETSLPSSCAQRVGYSEIRNVKPPLKYIEVQITPDVRGYLGKEGDRIVFGAMWVFKCEDVPPILTDCGGSFQRDFYLHLTAGFPTYGFPGGSVVKNPPANAGDSGDMGSIPGLEKIAWSRKWQSIQYSCQEIP